MLQTSDIKPPNLGALHARAVILRQELMRRSFLRHETMPAKFRSIVNPDMDYIGLYGGRGSGKSHTFGELMLAEHINKPGLRSVCGREFQNSLRDSSKLLLEIKIEEHNLSKYFRVLNTHIESIGGGQITFQGLSDKTADSIKSMEGVDRFWAEEAQSLSRRSLNLLIPTIRKPGSQIWFSWNPEASTDPVDMFLRNNPPAKSVVIGSTYLDNPYLTDKLREMAETQKARDYDAYAHIWLGEYEKHGEARVFKNWQIGEREVVSDAVWYYGADWGYSIDPSVMMRVTMIDERTLYIDYEAYGVGVEIEDLPSHFEQVPGAKEWVSVADNARPETISYMQRHGYPKMEASLKGKDSVKEGVIFLQGYDIVVHPRCKETIDELGKYSYKRDPKTKVVTPILEDKKNHVIDSLRYAVEKVRAFMETPGWATF